MTTIKNNQKLTPETRDFKKGTKTMKATIYLTAILTLSVALISCSDSGIQNVTEGTDVRTGSPAHQVQGRTLVWSHDGINVRAIGGPGASNEIFSSVTADRISDVLVTFDGWTNSDRSTYASRLVVSNETEDNVMLAVSGERRINKHHEIYARIQSRNQVRFYIELKDAGLDSAPSSASLEISNIRIFKVDNVNPKPVRLPFPQ